MTQAIPVYISKATFGPNISLTLQQLKYVTDEKNHYMDLWNKTTTT